jgi:hypothetical protein
VGRKEARSHSFVIRIWRERSGSRALWRGYVTHVMTDARLHFERLPEIVPFIQRHLESGEPVALPPGRHDE